MTDDRHININGKKIRRVDIATHWQLMWWQFRKNKMAMISAGILGIFLIISLFAEFIAPYSPGTRNPGYLAAPPMRVHFFDDRGKFHLRPFIYGSVQKRDPVTLRLNYVDDTSKRIPVRVLTRGESYKLWGLFKSDVHLFGVDEGMINLFGTDKLGRDLFTRIMYATRISISVGAIGVIFAFIIGIIMGGIAGYFGGIADELIMRLMEFIRSIPTLPLWMALAAALPRDWPPLRVYLVIIVILSGIGWTTLGRRVRSKLFSLREEDFVLSARLAGCSNARIILRHMLPSFMSYIIVDLTVSFPYIILAETSLSFLGLGLREPVVSWGVLLYAAQNVPALAQMPWLLITGLFVVIAILAFNFMGDGLRDAADPLAK
ncbi:MAG: ABC transporter permease [FCB group bacterium]|nr:ABC transporter permease [FCB group bacterium]